MLKKIKITWKVVLAFIIILLLSLSLNLYFMKGLKTLETSTVDLYKHPFTVSNHVLEAHLNMLKIHREMKDISVAQNQAEIEESINRVDEYEKIVYEALDIVYSRFLGDKIMVDEVYNTFRDWKPIRDEVIALTLDGKTAEANAITKQKGAQHVALLRDKIEALKIFAQNKAQNFFNHATDQAKSITMLALIAMTGIFIITIIIATYVIRSISTGLKTIILRMKELSLGEGDLTSRLNIHTKDELGELANYFNIFVEKIQGLVFGIKNNVDTLSLSSQNINNIMETANINIGEMAASFTNVAQSTQNTASISEESNASIEEISSTSQAISNEAEITYENVEEVLDSAQKGAKSINEVVEANESVNKSSKELYDIIKSLKGSTDQVEKILDIITNISEQTNLLALNAAIEAARAGEQGKGFAVVSDEIRKLAEESKESSNKISILLKDIQYKSDKADSSVVEGERLTNISAKKANEANSQFEHILKLIQEVSEKVEIISNSSKQQSLITGDMTKAMDELALDAQNNASAVQQINAVIEEQVSSFEEVGSSVVELKNIAVNLKDTTDQFKVE